MLSGTVEMISLAILDYCDIGVTDFSVRGSRSAAEISAFGRLVAPLVRRALAARGVGSSERLPYRLPSTPWRRYPV